jgi:hypothetical protein
MEFLSNACCVMHQILPSSVNSVEEEEEKRCVVANQSMPN